MWPQQHLKHAAVVPSPTDSWAFNIRLIPTDDTLVKMATAMTQKVRLESVGGDVVGFAIIPLRRAAL